MTRKQLAENFAIRIEQERIRMNLTQAQMAASLEMSLSSYKNIINGISTNIPVYVVYKAHQITGKFFFELCGEEIPESDFLIQFRKLPSHMQKALQIYTNTEYELASAYPESESNEEQDYTCMFIPTGDMKDGMLFDATHMEKLYIKKYREQIGSQIDCAIQITSNHLHPVYHIGDVLLISQQPPRDGDTGIFIHKPSGRIYIRKFRQENPCRLEPLTGHGHVITVDCYNETEMNQWIKFGYVLTKLR